MQINEHNDRRKINARRHICFFFRRLASLEIVTRNDRSLVKDQKTAEIYCEFSRAEDGATCRRDPWEKSSCTRWMTTAHKEIATEWRKASERANECASERAKLPHPLPPPSTPLLSVSSVTRHWCAVTTVLYRLFSTCQGCQPWKSEGRQGKWIRWRISWLSISRKHNGRRRIIENSRDKWIPCCFRRNAGNTSSKCK